MARVAEIDRAAPREGLRGAAGAGRQDAIEQIDAALHRADQVVGLADAHEIARRVLGQRRHRRVEHREHGLLTLADGEAADGIAVEADVGQRFRRMQAQHRKDAALHDAEEAVARRAA